MRAVLCGYYGMGNGGDEALLATLLQMLPKHVTPIVLSGSPLETQQRYGVEACPRKSLPAVISALRRSDVLIWGGGSLMQDATSALNPLYYGGLMALAQLLGLKTIAWAQGIGPLHRWSSKALARYVLRRCTAVSVRDRASADLLAGWRIPCQLAPDPVWALSTDPIPDLEPLPTPRVAISLRSHPWLTPHHLGLLIQALIAFQKTTQAYLVLVPFQPIKDAEIAETIHQQLPLCSQILAPAHPQHLKNLFRGMDMVIGMRFHALVMAAAEGCRCFAISYDPKVSQIMADLNLPGWDLQPHVTGLAPKHQFPQQATTLTTQWVEHYTQGESLSPEQIQLKIAQALQHQTLLTQTLKNIHAPSMGSNQQI